jgi:ABC-2 type transport system permease protein
MGFYIFLWLPTLAYPALLAYYSEVDWGPVATGYIGILGIGSLFLAVGLLASALSRTQLVAAVLTFAFLVFMIIVGFMETLFTDESILALFGYLNLMQHMDDFGKGVVDTRRLVYYFSSTALFLFLSARALESRKWR